MRKLFVLLLICLIASACALTDAGPPPPRITPVEYSTPRVVPTEPEVMVPTFAPRTITLTPTNGAAPVATSTRTSTPVAINTSPALSTDPQIAFAQKFDGVAAYAHTRYFTLPELAGRKAGAPGADRAADYIAAQFKAAGLEPAGERGTYFQTLTLPFIDLAEAPTLKLLNPDGSVKRAFKHRLEFSEIISGRANDGQADGKLVFVGYGSDKDLQRASDLQGTVALMIVGPTTPRNIVSVLAARGVGGLIQVTGNPDNLLVRYSYIPDSLQLNDSRAVVRVSRAVADELLQGSGKTLQDLEDRLSGDGAAFLATTNRVSLSVKLSPVRDAETRNVLGMIRGSDPSLANELYIVGGHYDHVGADPGGAVFAGANDNASGAAVVVALAEHFAQQQIKPKRTIVFAAWTGEEAGLVGSRYYVEHPLFPLVQTKGYINLDVVGAGSGNGLNITNESATLNEASLRSAADLGISTGREPIGGGSDHESFMDVHVPSVFYIWQRYGDIHVAADSFDKIDPNKLKATGQVAALTLLRLANTP